MASKSNGNVPQFHAEIVQFLADLGLTEYEAKTLSTLFKLKETEAPEISRIAQVPKTRVYDVLDRLTKKGLVIEIFGRPKKYRVVEPKEALDILVKRKKEEVKALEEKSTELKSLVEGFEGLQEEDGEKVMKVKDKQDFNRILAQEIGNAKETVVAFSKLDEGNDTLKEALHNAIKKKISVKMVSKSHPAARMLQDAGVLWKENDHGLNAYIIDGKKVILGLSDFSKQRPEYHFTIWNNNKAMANALQKYFDHVSGQK